MFRKFFLSVNQKFRSIPNGDVEFARRTLMVYAVIFVIWGLYRLLLRFPVELEEWIFKPIVFLLPILMIFKREGRKSEEIVGALGLGRKNIFLSLYFGLTLGIVYVLAVSLGGLVFSQKVILGGQAISWFGLLGIFTVSIATAVWEQITFSGFFLLRFQKVFSDEWRSVALTAFLFTLLHFPILWLESSAQMMFIVVQLMLLFLVGFGNAVVMLRTKNVMAPILSHAFWAFAVGLIG